MSETIDSKVVEMRFDNKDFEANTRTTMSTLDKLKAKLHFPGASKGLEEIGQTAKRVDFSGMSSGIQTVQMKFSALQVMGITALQNITNAAISAGKQLTDAITIDPVKDGFAEYETQMNSVQTILANTQKEGTNVQTVNKALDELNTYADKTIYNFTEMTRNIGTFTAAGVKLDASVSAIKGIANLAAVSGSNSQQASTAMYQLSQALAAGKVQLMDWNSVVNAGMGGQVFQDALIRTSEHLQTGAKAAIEAKGSFRESLQDEWLTTEVLTQTLDQFATAADTQEEYNAAVKKFVDQGYTQEQAKEMADMAKTAGDAATKVKTFSQLIDTLKEALGSGWTKTWQLIIGDFDEAKEVWTKVSDVLGGFINKASDARNAIVEAAMGNPYSDLAKNIQKVTSATSDYKDIVDSVIKGDYGNGQPRFDKLTAEGHDWARVQNLVNERLGCSFRYTEELTTSQEDLNKEQAKTIDQILKMSDAELKKNGLTKEDVKALKELQKQSEKTGIPINDLINDMDKLSGKELLHGSVANMGNALINLFTEIHNASGKTEIPKILADIAGTVLAVSVAIGILAGIAVLLGLVDTKQLAKGVLAVTLLGAIMTAMIWATRGANDVKGNVIAMAVAIGVMAAAVAALSMIDSTKLAIATACLGSLMGMFALIELAGSKAKESIAMIATMVIAVAALAGILGVMSALQVENALPNALALSALLLSLSVSMAIIGKVGTISAKALISVGVMTLVVAALAGILYLIRDLNPESSIGNAEALSILLLSLSASCGILAAVGLAGTAGFVGIGVLAALITAVGAIVAAIGALVKKFPQLEEFLDKGIPILQKIGYALGSFLGNIVGGFTEGATSGLPGVGKNLSDFMKNAQPFIDGAKGIDSSVTTGITSLCKAILTLTGTDFLNVIASVFSMGNVSFVKMGEQLKPFGEALSDYAQSVKGINAEDIQASAKAAKALVALNDTLPKSGGFLGKLLGNSDLANLGTQLKPFGEALSDYSNSVANVSPDKVAFATSAVKSLVEAINATDSVKATGTSTFVQAVDTLAETNISGFVSAFKGSSSKVRNVGSMLTSALAGGVKSKSNTLSATASNMAESMKNSIASKDKEFQKVGVALISALAIGIQAQVNQAVNAANYVGASAANGSGQAYTSFYMNGINLGRGLVLGMNAMQQSAYNSGYALGQAAVRGEKDGQKSHSPSKLTIQAGKWLGEGLIIGMNAMESKTYGAGKSMGETAFDSIRSALSGMNGIIDSDMDTTPTIRPVLDLTNVKATAGKLNGLFTDPAFTPLANLRAIGNISARNNQNGNSDEVVRAINRLGKSLNNVGNTYNSINGVTYDNGSEISNAVETLVRAATVGRRR